jgi:hypothetical protein
MSHGLSTPRTPTNILKRLLLIRPIRHLFPKKRVARVNRITSRFPIPVLRAEILEGRDQPGSLLDGLLAAALSNAVTNPLDDATLVDAPPSGNSPAYSTPLIVATDSDTTIVLDSLQPGIIPVGTGVTASSAPGPSSDDATPGHIAPAGSLNDPLLSPVDSETIRDVGHPGDAAATQPPTSSSLGAAGSGTESFTAPPPVNGPGAGSDGSDITSSLGSGLASGTLVMATAAANAGSASLAPASTAHHATLPAATIAGGLSQFGFVTHTQHQPGVSPVTNGTAFAPTAKAAGMFGGQGHHVGLSGVGAQTGTNQAVHSAVEQCLPSDNSVRFFS